MEEAIALTWKTMADRLRNLRIGAFTMLAFLAAAIVAAFVLGIAPASALLPALAGAGVFFMHRDRAVLFAWEDRVLSLWGASDLCLGIFRQTFMDHPHALKRSLKSLPASLPENA